MVEINNQRKAFLDMLAWSEGTDNGRQKNQKSWLWRHCRRRAIYWLLRSPSQTCHAKPKTQINRRDATSFFPAGGMPTASSLAWKTSLRKVRTLWHCSRLRSVALYPDWSWWISVRQSTVAAISGLHCRALGYGQFEHKADSLIAKFKEAGGTVREIDVWAESPRLSPLWLSASSSACHGLLIITVITPLPTKPSATKNARELKLANAAITDMQMRQRDVAALDGIHEELADAMGVSWRDARVMMLPLVVGCTSKQSVSQWSHHRLRRGYAASPDW